MKRRDFGLLAGTSLATAVMARPAKAQAAADPSLLTTTLTPLGGERAGNADGSIPAWTGGLTAPPLGPNRPVAVHLFEDEEPLYTIDSSNMAQYADLLSEGTKAQIQKFGMTVPVYKTHRTAAAPQYVYDNTAKNVTTAKLDPRGGRLGFTGAYGGVPFPIIDQSDPLTAGAQLIWNHLTAWNDASDYSQFSPGCVIINGQLILVSGTVSRTKYGYYDPNGSLDTFDGYFNKGHYYYKAPGSVVGQEQLVWHSTNINIHPDIVWTLLNGQGRVRKAPNEQYDTPNPSSNGIASLDEASCFYGNPSQYDWTLVEKKELLVPYNCNKQNFATMQDICGPHFIKPEYMRWEKHRVWVVEANLHPGIHNVNSKRRFYIDEDTWFALLGEGYDGNGDMWKAYMICNACAPSIPSTAEQQTMIFQLQTGDWVINGCLSYGNFANAKFVTEQNEALFEPQQMAANAAF
ncbi:MAG TPA: DUF1329 domain-containing protein [Acidocella sp.]|nr:DUF1329 domain-containing protein [Acidocella sp.]